MPPSRKIASNLLWTPAGMVRNPLVEIACDGRIVSVSQCPEPDRQQGVEFYAGVLAPGLVNAHCHLELSYLRGAIGEGCGFAGFAASMSRERERFTMGERLRSIDTADAAMWQAGIQAVGDTANGDSSFAAKSRSRIRYHTFVEFFGLRQKWPAAESSAAPQAPASQALAASQAATASQIPAPLQRLLRYAHTSLTPHSLYSVQDAALKAIAAIPTLATAVPAHATPTASPTPAAPNTPSAPALSIHFLESPAEAELFERRGELWEWYEKVGFECDFLYYGSAAERLVASVPRDRSVMLIHNCCVTQRDIDIIMEHFTAPVWWCLCPLSNRHISGLTPDVELLRRNGLNICLGTDSLASNRTLSIFEEMRLLHTAPQSAVSGLCDGLDLTELLLWATKNGAAALGMDADLGEVAPDRLCGLVLISGLDYDTLRLTPSSEIRRMV